MAPKLSSADTPNWLDVQHTMLLAHARPEKTTDSLSKRTYRSLTVCFVAFHHFIVSTLLNEAPGDENMSWPVLFQGGGFTSDLKCLCFCFVALTIVGLHVF